MSDSRKKIMFELKSETLVWKKLESGKQICCFSSEGKMLVAL